MENRMRKASTKFREEISPRAGSLHRVGGCVLDHLGLERGTRMPFRSTPIDGDHLFKKKPTVPSPHDLRRGWDGVVLEPPDAAAFVLPALLSHCEGRPPAPRARAGMASGSSCGR